MLVSLALHRMLKAGQSAPAGQRRAGPDMWRRIWAARLERLDLYLKRVRQLRKAHAIACTRPRS